MARVIGLSDNVGNQGGGRIAVIERVAEQEYKPIFPADIQQLLDQEVYPSLQKFLLFWVMMDTIRVHGYTRAAMSAIGRATVGTWWTLVKHEEWGEQATEEERISLLEFYSSTNREWDNIKDYQNLAYKLTIGAQYLKFFGQVAFLLNRNGAGQLIGFDHLPGLVVPNVDNFGYFKDPAFVQYPTKDPRIRTEFSDPHDVLYITNPDWEGSPLGGSDIEALTEFTLPLDIYLQTAAREYMKNTNRPELIYMLPDDISDEAFDTFVKLLNTKYAGPTSMGRNPVAVQGELQVKRIDDLPKDLPYQEARVDARDETLAASGVSGPVLGIGDTFSSANIREARRQFHETTMEPLFRMIEGGFYEQVHIRELASPGWAIRFNNPDFLTAVERATVHMRYIQFGVFSPNEAREDLGKDAREDGDDYVTPTGMEDEQQGSPPEGREDDPDAPSETGEPTNDDQDPPRGDQHDEDARALSDLYDDEDDGEYPEDTTFVTETVSPEHPEVPKWSGPDIEAESREEAEAIAETLRTEVIGQLVAEIKAWRGWAVSRMKRGMRLRPYHTKLIPKDISELVQEQLEYAEDTETVVEIFDDLFALVEEIADD